MKRLVIGDLHGCYTELMDLLDLVGLSEDDEIISIGDMIDRGPENRKCLWFFRDTPNARAILGNHERKHLRIYHDGLEAARSQEIAREEFGEDIYPEAIAYMQSLPKYIDIPEVTLVHGFFEPGVPLEDQQERVIVGVMGGEQYLMRTYDRPWYDLYDRDKPLIVGHRNYDMSSQVMIVNDRVYCIDTSCVYGGALTGVLLPDFKVFSVPARDDYWTKIRALHIAENGGDDA